MVHIIALEKGSENLLHLVMEKMYSTYWVSTMKKGKQL